MEVIRDLRMLGFTWTKIANILNVSRQTLYRHLNSSGLIGFTDVTDEELDGIIQSYKATHPNDGEQIIIGYLRSVGMCIPRRRIRESIHRVDPAGVEERARTTIRCSIIAVCLLHTSFLSSFSAKMYSQQLLWKST